MTAASSIPVGDWQFWVVTVVTLVFLVVAFRSFIPGLRKKKTTRVSLTINRESRKK
jgi:hypothetical protein